MRLNELLDWTHVYCIWNIVNLSILREEVNAVIMNLLKTLPRKRLRPLTHAQKGSHDFTRAAFIGTAAPRRAPRTHWRTQRPLSAQRC